MNKHMDYLGLRARDLITGFEGVVSSISFDLFGCVQVVLQPSATEGKINDSHWFDIKRLKILSFDPVMLVPDFSQPEIGPATKPARLTKA